MAQHPCLATLGLALFAACRGGATGPEPAGDAARGFALLAERGCTGCHASDAIASEPAPRLERVGARLFPEAIGAALGGGARMPDCLGTLPSRERSRAALELTHFLAARGGPLAPAPLRADAGTLERGRQLYHSIGCVACHAPFEEVATLARPLWDFEESFQPSPVEHEPAAAGPRDPLALSGIAARTSLEALASTLADPLSVHPSGRMPALALDAGEAEAVAAYLLYEDELGRGGVRLVHGPGPMLEVFEGSFPEETVALDALTPVRTEIATSFFEGIAHRDDDFAFRFRGLFLVREAGEHRFATRSDDGSVLWIDGKRVVDNDGLHGMSEQSGALYLAAGRHAFELTFYEHQGDAGLEVTWTAPGGSAEALPFERLSHLELEVPPRPALPFVPDPRLAERGRARYAELCAGCHEGAAARAAPLAELDPRDGCLAREPEGDAPRYRLAPQMRADLAAALRAKSPPVRTAEQRLEHELVRLSCGACHARGTLTGPDDARRTYFQVASGLDLGDQGRFPPILERAGAKLKPAWFHAVLESGGRARPYMKTRMPQFGAANVAALPELFAAADARLRDEREPAFSPEAVEAGKQLAGTKGLGCIQCHELAGHPSIGIPAVDLAKVHGRVYPGWFRELLLDPAAIGMNTRMPAMWVAGRSPVPHVLGGDPARQIDALWSYLSLGSSMPLPEGLVPLEGEYEVEVTDTPRCVGVFFAGVSPRTLAVGLPERVHYAFDVQNSRLAKAWRGRFLDARGTWYARAGQLEKPAGEDVLEFPGGNALMMLDERDDPWPAEIGRAAGYRVLGRSFDWKRRPTFEYSVCGVSVEEGIEPVVRPGGAGLKRRFTIPDDQVGENLFLRVAVGDSVQREDDETWSIHGGGELRVRGLGDDGFVHTDESGRMELRFPIHEDSVHTTLSANPATGPCSFRSVFEVEYLW